MHVDLDVADFLAVFPLQQKGKARLIGSYTPGRCKGNEHLKFEDVRGLAIYNLLIHVKKVNWF